MNENQIISFLKFVNQDDEDKYNMLVESAAIIRQKENIIKEAREYIESYMPNYDFDKTNLIKLLEILDKVEGK